MKLSEAMRRGAKLRAQAEKGWMDVSPEGDHRSCALIGAAEAAGMLKCDDSGWGVGENGEVSGIMTDSRGGSVGLKTSIKVPDDWRVVCERMELPPCKCDAHLEMRAVQEIVMDLNDIHRWSREGIAEWVEVVENKMEAEKTEPVVEVKAGEPVKVTE